jgi:hypothetical protein
VLQRLAPFAVMSAFLFWLVPFGLLAVPPAWPAALVGLGCSLLFWGIVLSGQRLPLRYALAYPLGALAALLIALRSTLRGGHQVEWRGRQYRVAPQGEGITTHNGE